ncbi:hypothetical protein [Shewanella sp.]|uniref:hypothetical protein n=1 Tax=Shewanella sp. TaxID=50422 RepID=UPI004053B2A4
MEINKEIKLKKLKSGKELVEVFNWSYNDWEFSYHNEDSRFDVKHPDGHWSTEPIYGKHNKAGAMLAIKQFLTLKEYK